MAANTTTDVEIADDEVVAALDVIRRHARLKNTVQVFVEAGVTEATGYRRLNEPGDIKLEELSAISRRFGIPLYVIAEGELAAARWYKENPPGPDTPGGLVIRPRGCNVVSLFPAQRVHHARAS